MRFIHPFIYGNWLISISAGILTAGVSRFYHSEHSLINALLIGFGTLFMYNFQRIVSPAPIKPHPTERYEWSVIHKPTIIVTAFVSLVTVAILSFLGILTQMSLITLMFAVILGYFYAAKVPGIEKPLREIPYLKIHLVVFVWLLCCFFFPILNKGHESSTLLPFIGLNYLYLLAVTIPFDIRDTQNDFETQKTIPQVIGAKNAKNLSIALILLFFIGSVFLHPELKSNVWFYVAVTYQIVFISRIQKSSPDYLFSGFIDGGILLLGIAYFVQH